MVSQKCKECGGPTGEFSAEICLHFSGGLASLRKSEVMTFTEVRVCLNCGAVESKLPKPAVDSIRGISEESG